jgi:hypothetical protein
LLLLPDERLEDALLPHVGLPRLQAVHAQVRVVLLDLPGLGLAVLFFGGKGRGRVCWGVGCERSGLEEKGRGNECSEGKYARGLDFGGIWVDGGMDIARSICIGPPLIVSFSCYRRFFLLRPSLPELGDGGEARVLCERHGHVVQRVGEGADGVLLFCCGVCVRGLWWCAVSWCSGGGYKRRDGISSID